MTGTLLQAAIEDNIAWCGAVSAQHGSDAHLSPGAWFNLAPAPVYYPNIITRGPQADVVSLIEIVGRRSAGRSWAVKDSFADLDLSGLGFSPMIEGQWYGAAPPFERTGQAQAWETLHRPEDLPLWAKAWDESAASVFTEALLDDPRIEFRMLRRNGDIVAGGIAFTQGMVTGLSNWFSRSEATVFDLGILQAISRPVVFWASGDEAAASGFTTLGRLRVWMS